MNYHDIKKNKEICSYLKKGNENLGVLGFTDHSEVHCTLVAERAAYILKKFNYRGTAEILGARFKLTANGSKIL